MFRVVLDTNIVVSACLTANGPSAAIVEAALLGRFRLCVSKEMLSEYRGVLSRPKFSIRRERAAVLLDGIQEIAEIIEPEQTVAVSSDDSDNRFLECAEAGSADVLVTGNLKHFPESFGKVRVISPRQFLNELGVAL
jgi:putative PIN family toxin of toxin-antitoxin system